MLAKKVPFLFWSEETGLTAPTLASGPIPPRWPQRTRTSYTSQAAAQTVQDAGQTTPRTDTHARTLDTLHRSALDTRQAARGRSVRRRGWRAWSVSETVQICTHSNMNDFQHKNVCKTVDINTRTCYYIDNTRTCYTTTKQEDKNHENHIKRYSPLCYH